jgi:hypothetical protein
MSELVVGMRCRVLRQPQVRPFIIESYAPVFVIDSPKVSLASERGFFSNKSHTKVWRLVEPGEIPF